MFCNRCAHALDDETSAKHGDSRSSYDGPVELNANRVQTLLKKAETRMEVPATAKSSGSHSCFAKSLVAGLVSRLSASTSGLNDNPLTREDC